MLKNIAKRISRETLRMVTLIRLVRILTAHTALDIIRPLTQTSGFKMTQHFPKGIILHYFIKCLEL